jgi:transposase
MNQRRGAYTPQFRQQMVELVGIGRKPIELAKEFGCHESSISAWVRQAQADVLGGGKPDAPLTTAERQELAQLRRQVRQVTQERDILAKATAWFANKDNVPPCQTSCRPIMIADDPHRSAIYDKNLSFN